MSMKRWIIVTFALLVAAGGAWYGWKKWGNHEKPVVYRTAKVERGSVVQLVRATGTVQPVKLVQVGTQVNGPIMRLGADFNSRVRAGDVVAQIDPAVYQANLAQADANLVRCRATVDGSAARLRQTSNDLVRAAGLSDRKLLSNADLDTAVANAAAAEADLKVAAATVRQTEAALQLAKANLGYTTITAPVDGVVVSRNVDEGQTVVASMSAQTLFTIATDLRTVLISASVPEADIGQIREKQTVTFNVDAYPLVFTGAVDQVRLSASTVQNVVTYPVIVRAANPDLKLFPGMTANISCIVSERNDVLKVPNAALRFKPEKAARTDKSAKPAAAGGEAPVRKGGGENRPKLWIQTPEGGLKPLRVTVGITDGSFTEVSGDELADDLTVVTGIDESAGKAAVVNPFMPTPPAARQTRPPRM